MPVNQDIYEVFTDVVQQAPDRTALLDEHTTLTFRQLEELAAAIAERIPEGTKRVGIVLDHSVLMIASIFGVLRAGAAFVMAETDSPVRRIRAMFEAADVDYVLTGPLNANAAGALPCAVPQLDWQRTQELPPKQTGPDSPAYILFTSRVGGVPKGVIATNANVAHCVRAFAHEFQISPQDIIVQESVCTSDIFIEEVFCSLLNGAELVIAPEHARDDVESLAGFIEDKGATVVAGTPYLMLALNRLERIPESIRLLISGGDVLRVGYVDNLFDQAQIYNTFGLTETTMCATYYRCLPDNALTNGTFPTGYPVTGSDVLVVNPRGAVQKPGAPGELLVVGDGIAAGYTGETDDTAFTELEGRRAFRTGDIGYQNEDGAIVFTRRRGTRVMIRGRHVEPAEVEHILCSIDGISMALVLPATDDSGMAYLTAYVVCDDPDITFRRIRKELQAQLPRHMVPEFIVRMAEFPLGANGRPEIGAFPVVMKEGKL